MTEFVKKRRLLVSSLIFILAMGIAASFLLKSIVDYDVNYETLYAQLEWHEGVRNAVYLDSRGIPHVGIGFNLHRKGARDAIGAIGVDYKRVMSGEKELTGEQIRKLLEADVENAENNCRVVVVSFGELDEVRKRVLIDMIFNLGVIRFSKFERMIAAVNGFDFDLAAVEMEDSKWYGQVRGRSDRLVDMMRDGRDPLWLQELGKYAEERRTIYFSP